MNSQNLSDDIVFEITKLIYKQMKQNFNQNFVGQKDPLNKFKMQYIQPLYPAKRNVINLQLQSDQTSSSNFSSQNHESNEGNQLSPQNNDPTIQNKDTNDQDKQSAGISKYSFRELCIYLGVGNFLCWKSYPPDPVYEDLGLGICLYLKFMKHLVYTLLILSILPIMQIVFFYSISQSNKFQPGSNYQKTLFSMTMGVLSLEGTHCAHRSLSNAGLYTFELSCPVGQVRVLGPVYSNSKIVNVRTCKQDINLFVDQGKYSIKSNQFAYSTDCNNQIQNCTYELNLASQSSQFAQLSVTFECINGQSQFGGITISRSTALMCSIIFDIIFIIAMVIFYWSQQNAESKQKLWFKSKQLLLNEFAIQVSHFSKNDFVSQFKDFLINLKKVMEIQSGLDKDLLKNIVQIRLPYSSEFIQNQSKRRKAYNNLYNFICQSLINRKRDPQKYMNTHDFINHAFKFDRDYDLYKQKLLLCLNNYLKYQNQKGKNPQKPVKVYLVFSKPKYKRLLLQNTVTIGRSRYLQFDQNSDKKYLIDQPPAPALILWSNKNKTHKVWRNIFSWNLSILIIGATYVLIAFMLWQRDNLLKNYNFNIECNTLYPSNGFSLFDDSLNEINSKTYTHCFCLSKSIFLSINSQSQCGQWRLDYTLYLFIPIIFSLGIVIINAIISAIYKALSRFQAHSYLTSELYSYILKKSLLLILNLALIIIVLSIDTQATNQSTPLNFLFQGLYNDITADWYLQVGLFIILSMIFNLFSPFAESLGFVVVSRITRIRMSFFKRKAAHKKLKSEYIDFYRDQIFPIEERYALLLAVLTITLCLNCVFPLMTIILLLTLFFMELNDKVLIIKAFQKPINFGTELHSKFMKSLLLILLIHLIVTSVLITQPFLLVAGIPTLQGSITQVNRNRFEAFFETGYALPYALLFVLILVSLCVNFSAKIYKKTKPNHRVNLGLDGIPYEQHKFNHLLNKYELSRTLALKKKEIEKLKIIQSNYMTPTTRQHDDYTQPLQVDSSTNIMNEQMRQSKQSIDFNNSQSILVNIAEFNLQKLENRQKQNIPDKQRIVKLTGMTAYDWHRDWVFFNEHPRATYEIPELNLILQKIIPPNHQCVEGQIFNYQHK